MTNEQGDHLDRLKLDFWNAVDQKYRAGCQEHGAYLGTLTPLDLVGHAMSEVLDQWCYLHALREKLIEDEERKL